MYNYKATIKLKNQNKTRSLEIHDFFILLKKKFHEKLFTLFCLFIYDPSG